MVVANASLQIWSQENDLNIVLNFLRSRAAWSPSPSTISLMNFQPLQFLFLCLFFLSSSFFPFFISFFSIYYLWHHIILQLLWWHFCNVLFVCKRRQSVKNKVLTVYYSHTSVLLNVISDSCRPQPATNAGTSRNTQGSVCVVQLSFECSSQTQGCLSTTARAFCLPYF